MVVAAGFGVVFAMGSAARSSDLLHFVAELLPAVVAGGLSGYAGGRRAWLARSWSAWLVVTLSVAVVATWVGGAVAIASGRPPGFPASVLDALLGLVSIAVLAPIAVAAGAVLVGPGVLLGAIVWSGVMWYVRRLAASRVGLG
jgi:hypothetical protein